MIGEIRSREVNCFAAGSDLGFPIDSLTSACGRHSEGQYAHCHQRFLWAFFRSSLCANLLSQQRRRFTPIPKRRGFSWKSPVLR